MSQTIIPAAVLVPLLIDASADAARPPLKLRTRDGAIDVPWNTDVLLTVRTHTVEHHKGQISFPGGAFESSDPDLEFTALRESHEEVGLHPSQVQIVNSLPTVPTVGTPFRIHPYVGIIRERPQFVPNPHEIGEILFVPLRHLLNPDHSAMELFERDGLKFHLKSYYYNDHRIWGATARILQTLLEKFFENG